MRWNMEIARYFMNWNFTDHVATFLAIEWLDSLSVDTSLISLVIFPVFERVVLPYHETLLIKHFLVQKATNVYNVHACNIHDIKW